MAQGGKSEHHIPSLLGKRQFVIQTGCFLCLLDKRKRQGKVAQKLKPPYTIPVLR